MKNVYCHNSIVFEEKDENETHQKERNEVLQFLEDWQPYQKKYENINFHKSAENDSIYTDKDIDKDDDQTPKKEFDTLTKIDKNRGYNKR